MSLGVRIVLQLLAEVMCVLLVVLLIVNTQSYVKDYRPLLASEPFDLGAFQTGDIVVSFGDYLAHLHPGHLGIVVEIPLYGQKCIWDLDSSQELHLLKPLSPFVQHALDTNGKVFVLHINRPMDPMKMMRLMRGYRHGTYDFQAIIEHGNFLLHHYVGFPGVPVFQPTDSCFYCSEIILRLLIDYGVLDAGVLQNIPSVGNAEGVATVRLFYPYFLLSEKFSINDFMRGGFWYHCARTITK